MMKRKFKLTSFYFSLTLSLFIHLFFFLLYRELLRLNLVQVDQNLFTKKDKEIKSIPVELLTKEEKLKKLSYRNRGIKESKIDAFTLPLGTTSKKSEEKKIVQLKQLEKNDKNEKNEKLEKLSKELTKEQNYKEQNREEELTLSHTHFAEQISEELSKGHIPSNLAIDIKLETGKGVDLKDLNEQELKFYSFNLRVFKSYISSIYHSLEDLQMENPNLKLASLSPETLSALVTYNKGGKIERISFQTLSTNEKVQGFFQKALEKNRVQNPPTEILEAGQFQLRYFLVINPRS